MGKYFFDVDVLMGFSHSGPIYEPGEGVVELNDNEVEQLTTLMRACGSTDIKSLNLETYLPDIDKKLKEAYHLAAYRANALHWLDEVLDMGYFDEEALVEYCRRECGYISPAYDEDEVDGVDKVGEVEEVEEVEDEEDLEDEEEEDEEEDLYTEARRADFQAWLSTFLQTADLKTLRTIYLAYLGFDNAVFELDQEAYEVTIPPAIIEMTNITNN